LKKLTNKEEITKFIQKLRESIKAKEEQKNNQSNKGKEGKGNGGLLVFGIVSAVLISGLILVVLVVVIRNKRRKRKY